MSTKVTTQTELDEALADPAVETIEISSAHGVWLTIRDDRGKRVRAYDSANVWAYNSANVWAFNSAKVVDKRDE